MWTGANVLLVALLALHSARALEECLRFAPDGTFTVAQLTDLHYGESPENDMRSDEVLRRVLETERPDFVVFSGDMVSGWCNKYKEEGWFEVLWRQLIAPVQAAATPYAIILGNHDDEAELNRRQILALDMLAGHGLSRTQQGPEDTTGASNYYLDVLTPSGRHVAARMWFFDSMDRGCGGAAGGWGCVGGDTVEWFIRTAARLPAKPSVAYVHIPLPEVMRAWRGGSRGSKGEDVCCPSTNTGLFAALVKAGVGQVWAGHDHNNDYSGRVNGTVLGFGRKTGYGSYGPPEGVLRGARMLRLRLGQPAAEAETWLALEDGGRERQGRVREPVDEQATCSLGGAEEGGQAQVPESAWLTWGEGTAANPKLLA